MKTYQRFVAVDLLLGLSHFALLSQVSQGGTPYSFSNALHPKVPTIVMLPVNVRQLLAEDEQDERLGGTIPLRFGYAFDANLGLTNAGTWDTLSNGDRVWRLKIRCPGAYSINLVYDAYSLPN